MGARGATRAVWLRSGRRPDAWPPTRRQQEIARLQRDNARLQAQLTTAQRVIDSQGKRSALLDQLVTSSAPTPTSSGEPSS